jgi:hypothetical protein
VAEWFNAAVFLKTVSSANSTSEVQILPSPHSVPPPHKMNFAVYKEQVASSVNSWKQRWSVLLLILWP